MKGQRREGWKDGSLPVEGRAGAPVPTVSNAKFIIES